MAKTIHTSIIIHASADRVWNILTDTDRYPEWNPFIRSIRGELKEGNRITARIQKMTFKPMVLVYEKNRTLEWLGSLYIKGLFDGKHRFRITDNVDGSVTFEQSEVFKGILVGLFANMLDNDTQPGFVEMNEALKVRAERR